MLDDIIVNREIFYVGCAYYIRAFLLKCMVRVIVNKLYQNFELKTKIGVTLLQIKIERV